jgi:dihydrofolate reductase
MFHILTGVYNLNGKFSIGNDNSLNAHFITSHFLDLINTGTLIIGRKTWFSIESQLRNKINSAIVLTNDTSLIVNKKRNVKFTNTLFNEDPKQNYFICGGISIINEYMKSKEIYSYYFAVINNYKHKVEENDNFIKFPLKNDLIVKSISKLMYDEHFSLEFRLINLSKAVKNTHYLNYFQNYKKLIDNESTQFGMNCSFDVSFSVPVISNINTKESIENILNTLKGNTFTDTLNKIPWNWRFLNAEYSFVFADTKNLSRSAVGGFDQIADLEKKIKQFKINKESTNYFEYMVFSNTNLKTEKEESNTNQLSFQICIKNTQDMYMNVFLSSCDYIIEFPKLLFEYSILLHILSKRHNCYPRDISFLIGNTFIQKNMNISLLNRYIPSPFVDISRSVVYKTIDEIDERDILLLGLN